jgi:hypothetical protein
MGFKKGLSGNKTGRPKSAIDFKKVDEYLQAQCSGVTVSGILGIHPDTLYKAVEERSNMSFSAYSAQKRLEGLEILRKSIWDKALAGNVQMQIWLSKQHLGYTESVEKLSETALQQLLLYVKRKFSTHELQEN